MIAVQRVAIPKHVSASNTTWMAGDRTMVYRIARSVLCEW